MSPRVARRVRLGAYGAVAAALLALGTAAIARLGTDRSAGAAASAGRPPAIRIEAPTDLAETVEKAEKKAAIDDATPVGQLVAAARAGDAGRVRTLLSEGVSPNGREALNGHGPLHQAARANSTEVVDILLAAGADPSAPDGQGVTPLMRAADSVALDAGRRLLAAGAEVNAQHDPDGNTALTQLVGELFRRRMTGEASPNGSDPIGFARLLLESGADPNLENRSGDEPLKAVVAMQDAPLLELLLEHGARLDGVSDIHLLARIPGPVGHLVQAALQDASEE